MVHRGAASPRQRSWVRWGLPLLLLTLFGVAVGLLESPRTFLGTIGLGLQLLALLVLLVALWLEFRRPRR